MQPIQVHNHVHTHQQTTTNIHFTYDDPLILNYRTSQFTTSQSQTIKITNFKNSMWSFRNNEPSLGWESDRYTEKDRQGREFASKDMRKFKIFGTKEKGKRGSFGQNYDRLASSGKNVQAKSAAENLISQRNSQNTEGYIHSSKIKPLLNLENKKGKSQKHSLTTSRYFDANQDQPNLDLNKLALFNRKTQTVAFVSDDAENTIQKLQDFTSSTSILSETLCEEDIKSIESTLERLDSGDQKDRQFNINCQQKVYIGFSLLVFVVTVLLCLFITKA